MKAACRHPGCGWTMEATDDVAADLDTFREHTYTHPGTVPFAPRRRGPSGWVRR